MDDIKEKVKIYRELQNRISALDNEKRKLGSEIFQYMKENNFDKFETDDSTVSIIQRTNKSWDKIFLKEKLSIEDFGLEYKEKSKTEFIKVKNKK